MVLDMLEVDMYDTIQDIFDQILPNLLPDIMSKELLKNEKYVAANFTIIIFNPLAIEVLGSELSPSVYCHNENAIKSPSKSYNERLKPILDHTDLTLTFKLVNLSK